MKFHIELTKKEAEVFEKSKIFTYLAKTDYIVFSEYMSETRYVAELEVKEQYFISIVRQAKIIFLPLMGLLKSSKEFIEGFIESLNENLYAERDGVKLDSYKKYESERGQYKISVVCKTDEKDRELKKINQVLDHLIE